MNLSIESRRKYEIGAYILLLQTAIIWAGTWPLGRWLVSEEVGGETIPPMIIASIRYFFVLWIFLIILRSREGKINFEFVKRHWKFFTFLGITSVTIYQAGYLIGEYFTAASDASVIISIHPHITLLISCFILKVESFGWKKMVGAICAFTGVFLVAGFSPNVNVPNRLLGDLLILMAAISYSMYTIASRRLLERSKNESLEPSSLYIVTWVSVFGFFTTLPVSLILSPEYINPMLYLQVPERIWLGLFYLVFLSTIAGYWFYLEGVKRLTASRASIFQNLVPILGVTLSAFLLSEKIDPFIHIPALILIILGITLVNKDRKKTLLD